MNFATDVSKRGPMPQSASASQLESTQISVKSLCLRSWPWSAASAQLKGFDRIRGILRQFLVEYRHRTIYIACHIILRWGEDFLASLVVARRCTSWGNAGTE